jgi:hypothetical protein
MRIIRGRGKQGLDCGSIYTLTLLDDAGQV